MTTHEPLLNDFLPIGLPSSAARFSTSLQYHATQNCQKKKISFVLSKDWTHNQPINNLNT